MRIKNIIISLVFSLCASLTANAAVNRSFATDSEGIRLVTDSIDYRSDLTRLYGRLIGVPHTSQRIDRVTLESAGIPFAAEDIDGVDFERWFQWEEDGSINVEIDFPTMKPARRIIVKAEGPRGMSVWTITAE